MYHVDEHDISALGRELPIPHKVRSWPKPLTCTIRDSGQWDYMDPAGIWGTPQELDPEPRMLLEWRHPLRG